MTGEGHQTKGDGRQTNSDGRRTNSDGRRTNSDGRRTNSDARWARSGRRRATDDGRQMLNSQNTHDKTFVIGRRFRVNPRFLTGFTASTTIFMPYNNRS